MINVEKRRLQERQRELVNATVPKQERMYQKVGRIAYEDDEGVDTVDGNRLPRLSRRRNQNSIQMISNMKVGGRRALREAQEDIRDDETLDFNITIEDMGDD